MYELVNDTLLQVINKIETVDESKNFTNWIITIAVNKTKDWLKKNKLKFENEIIIAPLEEVEKYHNEKKKINNLNNYRSDDELLKFLNIAIEQMSSYDKELIRLRLKDFTFKEIGEILNKNENAVKTGYHRALIKLKELCNNLYNNKILNNEVING